MDKDQIKMHSPTKLRRTLHVVGKSSPNAEVRIDDSGAPKGIWLGVAVIALFGSCVIGLVVNNKRTIAIQQPSAQQERIAAVAKQLSTLTQTDLIVFSDGRVWYVHSVRGEDMEVLGWIGDNTRSENIDSFVLKEDNFTIVRHNESTWPAERDRFSSNSPIEGV